MPIRRTISTRTLPQATKQYLFDLIVNGRAALEPSEDFTQNPDGVPGNTRKFAAATGLATGGLAAGAGGGADPGRFRLIRHIQSATQKTVWIYAEHQGRSSYAFDKITLPACRPCNGSREIICPACNGLNMRNPGTPHPHSLLSHTNINKDYRSCPRCNGRRVITCTSCSTPGPAAAILLDGKSISKNIGDW